jgi:hypothetical protein
MRIKNMPMTIAEIKQLKESEDKVEFKEAKNQYAYNSSRKSVLGYTVAFANEKGGYLVFGLEYLSGSLLSDYFRLFHPLVAAKLERPYRSIFCQMANGFSGPELCTCRLCTLSGGLR